MSNNNQRERKVGLGKLDSGLDNPNLGIDDDNDIEEEGGMIMGPGHPVFRPPPGGSSNPPTRGGPPIGARYDPISPLCPFSEPDNDEFMPPGPPGDDPAQPPRFPKPKGPPSFGKPGDGSGAPFFK